MNKAPKGPVQAMRQQERRALLSHAIFRWESAAALALTLILVAFARDPFQGMLPVWRWWFWLVLGIGAEILIVITTLLDAELRAKLVNDRFRAQFDPAVISNTDYRQIAESALRHRAEIELMRQRTRRRADRERLSQVSSDISSWTAEIVRLAQRLDDWIDPDSAPKPAESALQDTLTALQSTAARLQLTAAQGLKERRVQALRGEIDAQIRFLQETMESLA